MACSWKQAPLVIIQFTVSKMTFELRKADMPFFNACSHGERAFYEDWQRESGLSTYEMCRILELSLDAGGCGWSAQRLPPTGPAGVQLGGEWRRIQRAKGYRYVLINGEVTLEDDEQTHRYSGQLLRHGSTSRQLNRQAA